MKNVLAFMLGMAATIAAIKLLTYDGDDYDYEIEEALLMANYNKPKQIPTAWERKRADKKALLVEQDYLLLTLADAVSTQDEAEIVRSKARLAEIHTELDALK